MSFTSNKAASLLMQLNGRLSTAWSRVSVQWRLHFLIQSSLAIFFVCSQYWIVEQFDTQGIQDVESQASETADGLINGLNLLMITGQISDPSNRELLVRKMSASKNVRELRVIRAEQVNTQYGPGVSNERPNDELVRKVLASGTASFTREIISGGSHVLRAVIPFVASENFRGTNCLSCHQVKSGSVNGAADIIMDLSAHEQSVSILKKWLWSGMLLFQIGVSVLISLFVNVLLKRHISQPVKQLQSTIEEIHQSGDFSLRVALADEHPDIDNIANAFNSFLNNLEIATEGMGLLAKVIESSEEAILITDADIKIVFVNSAFVHITGYSEKEVLGENPRILKSGLQDNQFYRNMWGRIKSHGSWKGEIYNRKKNGVIFPEWQSISIVKNRKGEITNYVSICIDITQRKAAEEHIKRMANYDGLTGLANRNLLNDRMSQALLSAHRQQTKLAVMYLDLDNFKDINDGYGHAVGDALLKSAAERLLGCVREGDTVARQGGDEFILLMPDIDGYGGAAKIAEKLQNSICAPFFFDVQELFVSVSIGIALYPEDGENIEALFKHADAAMYSAKQDGRNRYHFFTQKMNEVALRRINLQNNLRHALQRNEFELHFQPQLNTETGTITGAEALIRWRDPKEGLISPAEFIPIAEDSGLIVPIGKWILQRACQEAKRWHDQNFNVTISVNVSGRQFKEGDFDTVVEEALKTSGLDPKYLELEMTEGVLLREDEALCRMLDKLKAVGVKFALDDFGTGYSSLSYLKRFPIDRIKIDQSFVRDVPQDTEDGAIVDAIIYIAHGLKMEVIAEGVETIEQLNFLRTHHCCDVQGYFVSRPVPGDQVIAMFHAIQNRGICSKVN
ncbi:MAG: diguanylate cyclase/phosphodiesterase with PAS/PAC [Gallionellaceae bacterium]|nr:MAG: diguanylate cyclase/phosphodiesterase with PAS/PAC [Gallionellaceae bacterium]